MVNQSLCPAITLEAICYRSSAFEISHDNYHIVQWLSTGGPWPGHRTSKLIFLHRFPYILQHNEVPFVAYSSLLESWRSEYRVRHDTAALAQSGLMALFNNGRLAVLGLEPLTF